LAGIFPFLLGQAIAFNVERTLNWRYFWLGFAGISLVLVGVELFNEYFDAREGTDRIFSGEDSDVPELFFPLGLCVFSVAFFIAAYLTFRLGPVILLFSVLGFLGAYFYVGPPVRWAYRGWGELVIGLCYGPIMVMGSFYLQSREINTIALAASFVLGLFIFSLAILNEIPDYIQDRLVGKKNLVVRFGKRKALVISTVSLSVAFFLLILGVKQGKIPYLSLISFLAIPLTIVGVRIASEHLENPNSFFPAIRLVMFSYIIVVSLLGLGYLKG
jgi:1,4-dihydroxy-2-naphthoate octaprenyltransferase